MTQLVKKVDVKRVSDDNETSLGVIYLDGLAKCGSIEDQEQKGDKVSGKTRVSNGIYKLSLRNEGGVNEKYKAKYNDKSSGSYKGDNWHRGMLCVNNAPNWSINCPDGKKFQYVLIHTGNTKDHTEACLLPNYVLDFLNDIGSRSGEAYEYLYPILRDSIEASAEGFIDIEYSDVESGK